MFEDNLSQLDLPYPNHDVVVASLSEGEGSSSNEELDRQKFSDSSQSKREPTMTKNSKALTTSSCTEVEDENTCTICMEPWTSIGAHRLTSLRCGHLYGKSCIERWVSKSACCPQCKTMAKRSQIRLIFARKLTALDVGELDRLLKQLAYERNQKEIAELREAKANMEIQLLSARVIELQALVDQAKKYGVLMSKSEEGAVSSSSMVWRLSRKLENALRLKGTANLLLPKMALIDDYSGALLVLAHHPDVFDLSLVIKISLLDTKSPICHIPLSSCRALCMAVSPWQDDEGQYAIGCVEGTVLLMTLHSDRLVKRLSLPSTSIQSNKALFSVVYDKVNRGALFIGNAEGQIWYCTDQADWKLLYTSPSRQAIHALVYSNNITLRLTAMTATELINFSITTESNSFSLVPFAFIPVPKWCYHAIELERDSLLLTSTDRTGATHFHMIKDLEQNSSVEKLFALLSSVYGSKFQPAIIIQRQKEILVHILVHANCDGSIAFVDCNMPMKELIRIPILVPTQIETQNTRLVAAVYNQMSDTLVVITSKDILFFYR